MSLPPDPQSQRLGQLLQLEHRARRASVEELGFVMVNETAQVVIYQQAALWQTLDTEGGVGRLAALSGVAIPEAQGPYVRWLNRLLTWVASQAGEGEGAETRPLTVADLPGGEQGELGRDWAEWLPAHALWCPLARSGGKPLGGLLFARPNPWSEGERQVLSLLAEHYAQCWILTHLPKARVPWTGTLVRRRRWLVAAAAILVAGALVPVRQSVLVPAEVVPIDPLQIRAPFDGIVDAIPVQPNQSVHSGQVLASLETAQLRSHQRVAVKAREIAEAEYGQAAQEAMTQDKAKGKLAVLRAKIDQQAAEVAYLDDQLSRADLTAPADGIAIFDSPTDWIGKPVSVGERVMLVADPKRVELELQVPVAEAVTFEAGSEVLFFRNVAPEQPIKGRVVFASYASAVTADGVAAYRFRAHVQAPGDESGEGLRIGLKGTAKLFGPRRPLALWLLRRPLAVVRQWLPL